MKSFKQFLEEEQNFTNSDGTHKLNDSNYLSWQ